MVVAAAMVLAPAVVMAQVVETQTGQALDSNYQIGSGGFNTVTGGTGGVNSQLYITGQTTGLSYFHGRGSNAPNQLFINPPSASINNFVRSSVGVPQAVRGGTYSARPYFSPTRTSFGVPGIVAGLTPPGSNAAIAQNSAYSIQQVYAEVTQNYRGISTQIIAPDVPTMDFVGAPATYSAVRPGGEPLFGVPQYTRSAELAMEVQRFLWQNRRDGLRNDAAEELDQYIDTTNRGGEENVERDITLGGQRTLGLHERELAASTRGGRVGAPPVNQDVYLDLLMNLQQQRRLETQPQDSTSEEPQDPRLQPGVQPQPGQDPQSGRPAPRPIIEGTSTGIVIHGLAGKSNDLFNQYMSRAQGLLKSGKYYEAAKEFEMAAIINRSNPMARLGVSLSMFAAGEPFTAGTNLRHAMLLLPPLMETRLDVASIMNIEDYKQTLRELDRRIKDDGGEADALLLFVQAYLHNNLGETEMARQAARMLAEAAPGDKLFQAYANYILSGKRPSTQPATSLSTPPTNEPAK